MTRKQKAKVEWMLWGTFYAFLFPFLSMWLLFHLAFADAFVASAAICAIGGPCMSFIFLFLVPYSRRLPFLAALLLQICALLLVTGFGFLLSGAIIGSRMNHLSLIDSNTWILAFQNLANERMRAPIGVALGLLVVMCALGQFASKLGPGVLWSWFTGKYHRPQEEERIFMFLDVKDSTPLAERLGNMEFCRLIQWFFSDLGEVLAEFKGTVSHYIGDEAVIEWRTNKGTRNANCIRFFFDLRDLIEARASEYEKQFGVVPEFKAGVHIGKVVAAEVGYGKTEIALYGDAVNTTARVVGKCAELGEDLLISSEIAEAIGEQVDLKFESMGPWLLKGKQEPMEIYRVIELGKWIGGELEMGRQKAMEPAN